MQVEFRWCGGGNSVMQGVPLRNMVGIPRWGFLNNLDSVEMGNEANTTSKINLNLDDGRYAHTLNIMVPYIRWE